MLLHSMESVSDQSSASIDELDVIDCIYLDCCNILLTKNEKTEKRGGLLGRILSDTEGLTRIDVSVRTLKAGISRFQLADSHSIRNGNRVARVSRDNCVPLGTGRIGFRKRRGVSAVLELVKTVKANDFDYTAKRVSIPAPISSNLE
jgi:hypothetical protein